MFKYTEQNTCLSLWVIPLLGEMSAKQTKGCPFPEEKVSRSDGEGKASTNAKCRMQNN